MLKHLCGCPLDGGLGLNIADVVKLTPDQIYFLVCDKEVFRESRTKKVTSMEALQYTSSDGKLKVRMKDGTVKELKSSNMSVVQMLHKKAEEKAAREKRRSRRRRRRGK